MRQYKRLDACFLGDAADIFGGCQAAVTGRARCRMQGWGKRVGWSFYPAMGPGTATPLSTKGALNGPCH